MGFIGNLFSGRKGLGWEAGGADLLTPTTAEQAQTAYGQTQQGLQQQQAFLQALQAQGGIQNQSNVFGQQQNLANLMQGIATGTGPNPALAQLNQTTGQNIAATTAALAGARGAGSNPALAARSAARLGADTQQQAAAQGATLAAQQQIAGMDALSRQQQAMGQLAGTQVGQQAAATNAYSTSAQNQQQNLLASINAQNQARVSQLASQNQANAAIQGMVGGAQRDVVGGVLGGAGQVLGLPFAATGGKVKSTHIGNNPRGYADGGDVQRTNLPQIDTPYNLDLGSINIPGQESDSQLRKGATKFGEALGKLGKDAFSSSPFQTDPNLGYKPYSEGRVGLGVDTNLGAPQASRGALGVDSRFARGGKVPALVSPGEKYLTPGQAQEVLKGKENPLNGKTIPGKAKVKGDSYENDTVPVTLEEGGCVIPRSVLQSDQPMKNAIKFVHAHMKKMAKGGKVENEKKQEQTQEQVAPVSREVAQEVLRNPHFLFTSENPHVTPALKMSYDATLDALKNMGYIAEPAQGKYGAEEPSIMVHNVTPEQVMNLKKFAKALGQESAIYSVGGKHEAHYLNGANEGKIARGEGTLIHEKEPEDFYTKTKNGLIFAHQIDWGKLYDE